MSAINLNPLFALLDGKGNPMDMNQVTFNSYLLRLSLLARSMFKWKGLPDSCNERFLEKVLYEEGRACFVYDKTLGYLTLRCNPYNIYNIYGEPVGITATGGDAYHKDYENDDFVYIRNNDECFPTLHTIWLYAKRLTEVERTADLNVNAQKTPVLILCDKRNETSFRKMYEMYKGNMPVLFASKDFNISDFNVLKTDAPFVANDLLHYKHDLWNECMTFLGLNNANVDKKERLITNEVESNIEQIEAMAQIMLKCREHACEQINKMYGLNVSVRLRTRDEVLGTDALEDQKEGDTDEL